MRYFLLGFSILLLAIIVILSGLGGGIGFVTGLVGIIFSVAGFVDMGGQNH